MRWTDAIDASPIGQACRKFNGTPLYVSWTWHTWRKHPEVKSILEGMTAEQFINGFDDWEPVMEVPE